MTKRNHHSKHLLELLLLLFLIQIPITNSLYSETISLRGVVIDSKSGNSLMGANVFIRSQSEGTNTDSDGYFLLNLKSVNLSDTLTINYLGYKEINLTISQALTTTLYKLEPKDLELGEIITIYGEKETISKEDIPTMVNEISPLQLQLYSTTDISNIFKVIPAVRIEGNDLDGRSIQIRGSSSDEVNVYIDGILLNGLGMKSIADLSIIPTEKIEKIDIHKGANLPLLGSGAFGGVVDIQTSKYNDQYYSIKGKYGDFESRSLLGEINIPIHKKLILNYFGQVSTMRPEIEYFQGEKYSTKTLNDLIKTDKNNHFISLINYNCYGKLSSKIFNYNLNYSKPNWKDINNNFLYSLSFNGNLPKLSQFDIYMNHFYNQEKISRRTSESTVYKTSYFSNISNLKIMKKIPFKTNHLQILGEYFHNELISSLKVSDSNYRQTLNRTDIFDNRASLTGVFNFQESFTDHPSLYWNTFIGLRGDFHSAEKRVITHTIGARVQIIKPLVETTFYGNFGSNLKFPTLLEYAYLKNFEEITSTDTTTRKLKAEYSRSGEIGFKLAYKDFFLPAKNIEWEIAFFQKSMTNQILRRPFDDIIIQTQSGRNSMMGIETSLALNNLYKYFSFTTSYIKLDNDDPLLYAFKPNENFSIQADILAPFGLTFSARYFYEGKSHGWYYDKNDNLITQKLSPFGDMDVSVGYGFNVKRFSINLQITGTNIFDSAGYSYYYLKKRYWMTSLSFSML